MLNLVQLQERLKEVPVQYLMNYANGSNPQVPPFIALGELNRRKKMQETVAAEQAQQMEGAPTIKDQIEQSTGLMALQGARQQQAAQQQAMEASNAPIESPNTTTSEPVQMASGGYLQDSVMPRDFRGGGVAGLPVNMFDREGFAGGGIVAFNGEQDSYVEQSPGFYQLQSELPEEEDKNIPFEQRILRQYMKDVQGLKSLADMKREAGLETPPTKDVEKLAALEAQRRRMEEEDTVGRRLMAIDPLRIAGSMGEYLSGQEKQRKTYEDQIAAINDLRTQAEYEAKVGDLTSSRAHIMEAAKIQKDLASTSADVGYTESLSEQAGRGKVTNFTQLMEIIDEAKKNPTPENIRRMQSAITASGYVSYQAPRVEATERATEAGSERVAVKEYSDLFDPKKLLYGSLSDEMDAAAAKDKKAGGGTFYQDQVRLREYNRIRESLRLPPAASLPGSSTMRSTSPSGSSKIQGFSGREIPTR